MTPGPQLHYASRRLLDVAAVAELLNIAPSSVHKARLRGAMPEPDHTVSGAPAWWEDTIEAWVKTRPRTRGRVAFLNRQRDGLT